MTNESKKNDSGIHVLDSATMINLAAIKMDQHRR